MTAWRFVLWATQTVVSQAACNWLWPTDSRDVIGLLMYDPIGLFIKLESWPVYTAGNYPEWIGIDVLGRTEFQLQDGYSLISVKKKNKTAEWCTGQKSLQKTFRYMMMKRDWSFPVLSQSMLISIFVNHENMCEFVAWLHINKLK